MFALNAYLDSAVAKVEASEGHASIKELNHLGDVGGGRAETKQKVNSYIDFVWLTQWCRQF